MSTPLAPLYHWSPGSRRRQIVRYGLKPTCPTAVVYGAGVIPGTANGRRLADEDASRPMVCLGTSPSHAWALSGEIMADKGESWDLWQVVLGETDEVHPLPFFGHRLDEIRVANRIPKGQVWLVGQRVA